MRPAGESFKIEPVKSRAELFNLLADRFVHHTGATVISQTDDAYFTIIMAEVDEGIAGVYAESEVQAALTRLDHYETTKEPNMVDPIEDFPDRFVDNPREERETRSFMNMVRSSQAITDRYAPLSRTFEASLRRLGLDEYSVDAVVTEGSSNIALVVSDGAHIFWRQALSDVAYELWGLMKEQGASLPGSLAEHMMLAANVAGEVRIQRYQILPPMVCDPTIFIMGSGSYFGNPACSDRTRTQFLGDIVVSPEVIDAYLQRELRELLRAHNGPPVGILSGGVDAP